MTATPAGQQPPTSPVLGAWQPLHHAGATPHTANTAPNPMFDRLIYGRTPSDWAIRAVLALVMTAALAVGTWSIYTLLTEQLHAPKPIAVLGCGMFDIAALFFALLSQKYAVTTDSGLAPRLAMLAMVSTSAWVNWQHGQLEGWGIVGSVILAAAPVIAELAFEMFHRYAHRETLRNLGRVAQTLPTLGKWAWLRHPIRSHRTLDGHIKAALTEHEAIAERREELAGVRAKLTVGLPIAATEVSPAFQSLMQVSLERDETAIRETGLPETGSETTHRETAETSVSRDVETRETTETARRIETRDRSPETETSKQNGETETGLQVSRPRSPSETTVRETTAPVTPIGDRETETKSLVSLMRSRGGAMQVSLNDAIETTGRPKATAAKRLKAARDLYLAETA
ncbi:DUF2637 domain-containing protein [Streptomyces caniscabiei]|uniref:DUF2637 domain-containing protein n=1 Tax=Streptomyces caniscabiei TaxID=2746961 RepID=UPI001872791B|nr:DUF2637 domain-containing protein [Streptomyces caniscabiei]MBE4761725.1 DUF2637 domain-containing protein [Streptomyces caniscabiei]MDX2947968.1 DUF2637 domain-containing protein [Streptomyces caniscabiei]